MKFRTAPMEIVRIMAGDLVVTDAGLFRVIDAIPHIVPPVEGVTGVLVLNAMLDDGRWTLDRRAHIVQGTADVVVGLANDSDAVRQLTSDLVDPDVTVQCPNNWHRSAPSRARLRCPECPPDALGYPAALGYGDAPLPPANTHSDATAVLPVLIPAVFGGPA